MREHTHAHKHASIIRPRREQACLKNVYTCTQARAQRSYTLKYIPTRAGSPVVRVLRSRQARSKRQTAAQAARTGAVFPWYNTRVHPSVHQTSTTHHRIPLHEHTRKVEAKVEKLGILVVHNERRHITRDSGRVSYLRMMWWDTSILEPMTQGFQGAVSARKGSGASNLRKRGGAWGCKRACAELHAPSPSPAHTQNTSHARRMRLEGLGVQRQSGKTDGESCSHFQIATIRMCMRASAARIHP